MTIVQSLSYFRSAPFRRGRREPDSAQIELLRLKLAHTELLRYAEDLKLAYEAERARRLELTQVTLELVGVLSVLPTQEPATQPAAPSHKQAA
jgi:hypothetical protein